MKKIIFVLALLPHFALANDTWFCTADGYDRENRLAQISGEYQPTEWQAQASALGLCQRMGLSACRVASCFNVGMPTAALK